LMAALGLVVWMATAVGHWLLEPLLDAGTWLFNLVFLPWLPVLLLVWLLAGGSGSRRSTNVL
jgi:hypothetical protein